MENKHTFVYSGTTLENFLKCAYIDRNDKEVYFNKCYEPKHANRKELFTTDRFREAFLYSIVCSGERKGMTPLIMQTLIDNYKKKSHVFRGPLKIYHVWTVENIDKVFNINPYSSSETDLKKCLRKKDAFELILEHIINESQLLYGT